MNKPNEYRVLLAEAESLLADSTNNAIKDRIELRNAVCAYLDAEQKRGASLASVLDSVEAILFRAAGRLGEVGGHQKFAQQLIDWCLELDGQRVPKPA